MKDEKAHSSGLPVVKLKPLKHRGKHNIALAFDRNEELEKQVRKLKGATWTRTHRCWYVQNKPDNLKAIYRVFKGKAWIDTSKLFRQQASSHKPQAPPTRPTPLDKRLTAEQQKAVGWYKKWMQSKGYAQNTINTYSNMLEMFFTFIGDKPVREADHNDMINFNSDLIIKTGRSESYQRQSVNAVKLFYSQVEDHRMKVKKLQRVKHAKRIPEVLSLEETQRLFDSYSNLKHKTMMVLTYACGLRRSEVLNLSWKAIDRSRMMLYVRLGKGKKDRQVIMSPVILNLLERYWKAYKTRDQVFEGQFGGQYTATSMRSVLKQGLKRAGIKKDIGLHGLRHSYATHVVEQGTDVHMLQKLLGHKSIKTTAGYLHVSKRSLHDITNPIEGFKL